MKEEVKKMDVKRLETGSEKENGGKSMLAAVIERPGSIRLAEVEPPPLEPGEVLIKVEYCGICGSDLHVLRGAHPTARFPVTPGHEFVGRIHDVRGANPSGLKVGDLAVAQPFFSCGVCPPCAMGRDNVCENLRFMGAHVNGAFAQFVKAPTRKTYRIPEETDRRLAALAEPVAVAVHDVRRSGLRVGETALVVGGGAIGLLVAIVARHSGAARVVISEPSPYRRGAASDLGFETVDPAGDGFDAHVRELSGGGGFNVVFEASGVRPGIAAAVRHAAIAGKVMIIGMTSEPYPVDLSAVFAKELTLEGVRIHAQYNFIGAVELLKTRVLDEQFARLVTNVFPLAELEEAFAFAQSKADFLKVLVEM